MSFSVDGITSYLDTTNAAARSAARADDAQKALSGLSSESSEEELTEAVESFESYMVEQVLKQLKESMTSDEDDEDAVMGQYKDMYMDATIREMAKTMVSEYGGTLTKDLVEQMKVNYGIE